MTDVLLTLLRSLSSIVKTRAALQIEIVALRHQVNVLRRSVPNRPRLRPSDRLFWTWLSHVWPDWRSALVLVKPETVVAWHRKGFRFFWTVSAAVRPGLNASLSIQMPSPTAKFYGARIPHLPLRTLIGRSRPTGGRMNYLVGTVVGVRDGCLRVAREYVVVSPWSFIICHFQQD